MIFKCRLWKLLLDHVVIDANGLIDWCHWLIDIWCNVYVFSLMRMMDFKWKPIDEDGSMSYHWYMMHSWCIWCSDGLMQRWIIIVLSWLIRYTNGWTPKWSPYGESYHGKMLCRLSYPRSMVREPMLICGIMRWNLVNFSVKLS